MTGGGRASTRGRSHPRPTLQRPSAAVLRHARRALRVLSGSLPRTPGPCVARRRERANGPELEEPRSVASASHLDVKGAHRLRRLARPCVDAAHARPVGSRARHRAAQTPTARHVAGRIARGASAASVEVARRPEEHETDEERGDDPERSGDEERTEHSSRHPRSSGREIRLGVWFARGSPERREGDYARDDHYGRDLGAPDERALRVSPIEGKARSRGVPACECRGPGQQERCDDGDDLRCVARSSRRRRLLRVGALSVDRHAHRAGGYARSPFWTWQ